MKQTNESKLSCWNYYIFVTTVMKAVHTCVVVRRSVRTTHTGRNIPCFAHIQRRRIMLPNTEVFIRKLIYGQLDLHDTGSRLAILLFS